MKFEVNWPYDFWENYVLIYWWDSNMSEIGWNVKGQAWPLELIYSHRIIRLNISSDYDDFGFNSFQKKSNFNALGANLTLMLSRSRSTYDHCLNKLGGPHIPNATYQVPRLLAFLFWGRFLKGFYHIWAWPPSWSCVQDHLNKLLFPNPKVSPYEIWVQLAQWCQRRKCLKMLTEGRQTDDGRQSHC